MMWPSRDKTNKITCTHIPSVNADLSRFTMTQVRLGICQSDQNLPRLCDRGSEYCSCMGIKPFRITTAVPVSIPDVNL